MNLKVVSSERNISVGSSEDRVSTMAERWLRTLSLHVSPNTKCTIQVRFAQVVVSVREDAACP